MKVLRLLCVACFALLGAAWAKADTVPGHFQINLNDFGCVPSSDSVCTGGWDSQGFTATGNTGTSTEGFTEGEFTAPCFDSCEDFDPYILISAGGRSDPFNIEGTTFSAIEGGGIFNYFNPGPGTITDILITTTFVPGETYHCSVDDTLFSFCGFMDPPGNQLEILYTGGNGIPVATPEPASGVLLLIASAAVVAVHRMRSAKVNA